MAEQLLAQSPCRVSYTRNQSSFVTNLPHSFVLSGTGAVRPRSALSRTVLIGTWPHWTIQIYLARARRAEPKPTKSRNGVWRQVVQAAQGFTFSSIRCHM